MEVQGVFGFFDGFLGSFGLFVLAASAVVLFLGCGIIPAVYSTPYLFWFFWNAGKKGLPQDIFWDRPPLQFFPHQAVNATKVYRFWLTGKPYNITDF